MENQESVGEVVTSVANDNALVVDQTGESAAETTPPHEDTETHAEEKIQAEKTFTQAELDEILEKKTAKLARQRDKERAQRAEVEQELQKFKPAYRPDGEPKEDQYETAKEYAQAYSKWEHEQVRRSYQAEQAQKADATFKERVNDFREEMEDVPDFNYDKLTRLPLSDAAVDALLDSDMRAKLAVHLLANKDEVDRISKFSPARQASELGKLEAKLSAAPVKKISKAPEPITPVGGKGSVVSDDLYDPKLQANTDAWIVAYNKKQADKRRR